MTAQAGWYPDPSGNAEKLRFWDGSQWTNDFMDAAAVRQQVTAAAQYQAQVQQTQAQYQAQAEAQAQAQAQAQTQAQTQAQAPQMQAQQDAHQQEQMVEAGFAAQVEQVASNMSSDQVESSSVAQEAQMVEAGLAVEAEQAEQEAQVEQIEEAAEQSAAQEALPESSEPAEQVAQAGVQPIAQAEDDQGVVQAPSVQEPIAPAQAVQEPLAQPLYGVQQANQGGGYYQPPNYGTSVSYVGPYNPDGTYVVDSGDATLRLIAFILYMFTLVSVLATALFSFGFTLICLAWVIPMSIRCWSIYKGQKPNTIAFGVCTLLFVNVIAGILLLVSKKDV